jgi:hypothetical protein
LLLMVNCHRDRPQRAQQESSYDFYYPRLAHLRVNSAFNASY